MCAFLSALPCAPPPSPPPPAPSSNQNREQLSRAARAYAAEVRWGRVTCVHTVGLSGTPAVVKSAADSPLFTTSLVAKFRDEVSCYRDAVKATLSRWFFSRLRARGEREDSPPGREFYRMRVCEMKRPRNASGNANVTSRPDATVGLSESQLQTILVSFPLF